MRRGLPIIAAALLAVAGCGKEPVRPSGPRPRAVAFSPAITDIIFDMGLGEHVVGVTSYCVLPPGERRPAVGDRINVSAEAILSVAPDVVLIQQDPKSFEALRKVNPAIRVEALQIETLDEIVSAIERIGKVLEAEEAAGRFKEDFLRRLAEVRRRVEGLPRPRVLFVLGCENPVVAGDGTFIHDLIGVAGGVNAGADVKGPRRWRPAGVESILAARPEVLICQVAPSRERRAREFWLGVKDLPAARTRRVFIVTDRRWTIPSTRVAELAGKISEMVHPRPATAEAGDD